MSALTELVVPTTVVATSGGSFAVRGLNLDDINLVLSEHRALIESFMADQGDTELSKISLFDLVQRLPEVVGMVIAIGADDLSTAGVMAARRLPGGVQLRAIEAIVELTTHDAGGAKNVAEGIRKLLGVDALPVRPKPSTR